MRKLLTFLIALSANVVAVVSPASAQLAGGLMFPGPGSPAASGGGGYTGPGDVVSGASFWAGLRAYNLAYATANGNLADIVDTATGAASCTIKAKTNGDADLSSLLCVGGTVSVTTFCTVTHPSGCSVTKLYDQISTHDLVQTTLAVMPQLVLGSVTGLGSTRPALSFTAANSPVLQSLASLTVAQPLFTSHAAKNVATGGQASFLFDGASLQGGYDHGGSDNFFLFSGASVVSATVTDSAWHALENTYNNASSEILVDGVSTTGSLGNSTGFNGLVSLGPTGPQALGGNVVELGIWPPAAATSFAANKATLSSNKHSYWGF
jgi:hypothetical protein